MSKAIMISIHPKWCKKIADGEKTIEVRKTRPKIDTPFKCYIYCTKDKPIMGRWFDERGYISFESCNEEDFDCYNQNIFFRANGKVIGEFVCDGILSRCESSNADMAEIYGCIKREQLFEYSQGKELYGWYISDLVIYDKPKELSEFYIIDKQAVKECGLRERIYTNPDYTNGVCLPGTYVCKQKYDFCRGGCWKKSLSRPPQSWCYVEEL